MVNFIHLSIVKRRFPIFGDENGKNIQMFHPIIGDVIMERIAAANPH